MRRTLIQWLAASSLVLAMAGTAVAADAVPTVEVSGFVDGEGQPVEVESAKLEEFETPDSEPLVTPIEVADDGTFTVALREWGTPEQPALARITVFAPPTEPVENEDGCMESFQLFGVYELDIPGLVPTEQIVLVFNQATHSVACESDETAPPDAQAPSVTLPPTDGGQGAEPAQARSTAVVLLVCGIALLAAASIVGRRRPARR
jgi:hypothetical protein